MARASLLSAIAGQSTRSCFYAASAIGILAWPSAAQAVDGQLVHPPAATPSQPRGVLRLRRRPYHDGRKYVLDEFTHESLAIRVGRKLNAIDVIDVLSDLFIARGVPADIRSDNGPEFVAKAVREWIGAVGAKTAYIAPGSPWETGYIESFNARLRDELLDGRSFIP
jgi:transposase InsO family protein